MDHSIPEEQTLEHDVYTVSLDLKESAVSEECTVDRVVVTGGLFQPVFYGQGSSHLDQQPLGFASTLIWICALGMPFVKIRLQKVIA